MRYVVFVFLLALLLPAQVHALEISEYNITFEILPNGYVSERVSMVFAERLNTSTLNYVVLGEVADLSISGDLGMIDYTLERTGNENNVKFAVPEGTGRLEITFTAKDLVFAKDSLYNFFTNLQPPESDRVNVIALLPRGFAVYRDVVYPDGRETLTDGERIYLKWEFERPDDVMISFKFYSPYSDYSLPVLFAMGFAIVIITGYLTLHYRKRVKREFMRGFTEDERKVLGELAGRKVCMQKKLEKQFGFSRAKMTRVVKRLEKKGLVERERVGRTNRLFYRK